MVEPVAFAYNVQTAENNHFQQNDFADSAQIQLLAYAEFQEMVAAFDKAETLIKGMRFLVFTIGIEHEGTHAVVAGHFDDILGH